MVRIPPKLVSGIIEPLQSILTYRLDGVQASKLFLKDVVKNKRYNRALQNATRNTYFRFRNLKPLDVPNYFLCAVTISDEVSFALYPGDNMHGNRVFKIGSLLSGNLSVNMTNAHELTKQYVMDNQKRIKAKKPLSLPKQLFFDSRPLIINNIEHLKSYISYRWMLGYRNAMCKVLRLKSSLTDEDIYETPLKNDVEALEAKINRLCLWKKVATAMDDFSLFIPSTDGKLERHPIMKAEDLPKAFTVLEDFYANGQAYSLKVRSEKADA